MVAFNLRTCNTTLDHESTDNEIKAYGSLTFHELGLILSAATGLFATILSFYLMIMHATHYSRPYEQRHILRILFMIPIYSVVSFLSFYFYHHYVYYQVLRDCYDAFAIASFFSLLCHYIQPDLHSQKEYFRKLTPKNWLLPLNWFQKCCGSERKGPWRVPRSGLTWFNIIWVFIFQYCLLRVVLTIVDVITQYFGRYCVEGLSPAYFHVWSTVISAISVSLAMYCLIQFYYQIRQDISEHSPLLKILSIKLVIFFVFWQTIILSFLNDAGVIQASEKIAQPDITIGIPAILICIEMAIFSILHVFAYPWKPYSLKHGAHLNEAGEGLEMSKADYKGGPLGVKAYLDAFNPWDMIKAIGRGFKWAFVGRRRRLDDPSYKESLTGTALQDGIPNKGARYEQLDDDAVAEDDHPYTYNAFNRPTAGSGYSHGNANLNPSPAAMNDGHFDQRTVMPGRIRDEDGFMPVPSHAHEALHHQQQQYQQQQQPPAFDQDTSYHNRPRTAYGQALHMPDQSHYYGQAQ